MTETIFTVYASTKEMPCFLIKHKEKKYVTEDEDKAEQVFKEQVAFFDSYQPPFNTCVSLDKIHVYMETASGPIGMRIYSSEYREFYLTEKLKAILNQIKYCN